MSTASHGHADHPPTAPAIGPTDGGPVRRSALIALVAGTVVYLVAGFVNLGHTPETGVQDFFLTYLVGYVFWLFPSFGALGLMCIAYLTTASWGVVMRRVFQAFMRCWPLMAVLFVPVALSLFLDGGRASPFWWADRGWVRAEEPTKEEDRARYRADLAKLQAQGWNEGDHLEIAKVAAAKRTRPEAVEEARAKIRDYLNVPFFLLRAVLYFAILGAIIYFFDKWSRPAEESDDPAAKSSLKGLAGPGLIIWALSGTWLITDWVMSVEPTWASSMFPVVFGMDSFMTAFSLGIIVFYSLNAGRTEVMSVFKDKFRIDIGSLLLGFTMVWAYATFCQYMLIWAGNLPEEIAYYRKRGDHGWQYLAYFLMLFHWLVPFVVLLFREVKTHPNRIRMIAGLLLVVAAADVIWWIVPSIPHERGGLYVVMAIGAVLGVGGVWGLYFAKELAKRPILPQNSETAFLAGWGHHEMGHADTLEGVS